MPQFESTPGACWGESGDYAIRVSASIGSYIGEMTVKGAHLPGDPTQTAEFVIFYPKTTTDVSEVTSAFMKETGQQCSGVTFVLEGREINSRQEVHLGGRFRQLAKNLLRVSN